MPFSTSATTAPAISTSHLGKGTCTPILPVAAHDTVKPNVAFSLVGTGSLRTLTDSLRRAAPEEPAATSLNSEAQRPMKHVQPCVAEVVDAITATPPPVVASSNTRRLQAELSKELPGESESILTLPSMVAFGFSWPMPPSTIPRPPPAYLQANIARDSLPPSFSPSTASDSINRIDEWMRTGLLLSSPFMSMSASSSIDSWSTEAGSVSASSLRTPEKALLQGKLATHIVSGSPLSTLVTSLARETSLPDMSPSSSESSFYTALTSSESGFHSILSMGNSTSSSPASASGAVLSESCIPYQHQLDEDDEDNKPLFLRMQELIIAKRSSQLSVNSSKPSPSLSCIVKQANLPTPPASPVESSPSHSCV